MELVNCLLGPSQHKMLSYEYMDPRDHYRYIFIIEILTPEKDGICIETGPRSYNAWTDVYVRNVLLTVIACSHLVNFT